MTTSNSTSRKKARKATTRNVARKGGRKRPKGSSLPYGKYSGLTLQSLAPAADGTTKVFAKITSANQVGDQATEGDIFRQVKNADTAQTIYLGETAAQANGATGYPLAPGETFVLLGPSGVGWKGDLYAKGNASAVLATMAF